MLALVKGIAYTRRSEKECDAQVQHHAYIHLMIQAIKSQGDFYVRNTGELVVLYASALP